MSGICPHRKHEATCSLCNASTPGGFVGPVEWDDRPTPAVDPAGQDTDQTAMLWFHAKSGVRFRRLANEANPVVAIEQGDAVVHVPLKVLMAYQQSEKTIAAGLLGRAEPSDPVARTFVEDGSVQRPTEDIVDEIHSRLRALQDTLYSGNIVKINAAAEVIERLAREARERLGS